MEVYLKIAHGALPFQAVFMARCGCEVQKIGAGHAGLLVDRSFLLHCGGTLYIIKEDVSAPGLDALDQKKRGRKNQKQCAEHSDPSPVQGSGKMDTKHKETGRKNFSSQL